MRIIALLALVCCTHMASGQEENWDAYLADHDGTSGAVTLRLDLAQIAPVKSYPFVLITGIAYPSKRKDGFPENATFRLLYEVNDDLAELLNGLTDYLFVGTHTHQYKRMQYFYVESDRGLEDRLVEFYQERYPGYKYYIDIHLDPKWEAYLEFLYPEEAVLYRMQDEAAIKRLQAAGDHLEQPRKITHYLLFSTQKDLQGFQRAAKSLGYTPQLAKAPTTDLFALTISRIDPVDIETLHPITTTLRELAKKHQGTYKSWEADVVK